MQIKPILARLQSAIGRQDLIDQMVLIPEPRSKATKSRKTVSFVVSYNGSCNSQTALDMTLWIAHQTRLATQKQVTVHVVYVLDRSIRSTFPSLSGRSAAPADVTACLPRFVESDCVIPNFQAIDPFDHADYVLWQARCMAEEWRGSLEAHLRFGSPAEQLRQVIETEQADLLLLGCTSAHHPLVSQLAHLPCPVLGIPRQTHPEEGAIASSMAGELQAY